MAISRVTHVFLIVKQLNKPLMYAFMSNCFYDPSLFSMGWNKVRQEGFKGVFGCLKVTGDIE